MIEQTIEIVTGVKRQWTARRTGESVEDLRVDVAHRIADTRNIAYQSVIDKPGRKFAPDITSLPQFDVLLEQFLVRGDKKLKALLLKHAHSAEETSAINAAFGDEGSPPMNPVYPTTGPSEPVFSASNKQENGVMTIKAHNKRSERSIEFRRSFGRDLEDAVAQYGKETVFGLFRAMAVIRCQAVVRLALGDPNLSDAAAVEAGMNYDPSDARRGRARRDPVSILAAQVASGELTMEELRRRLEVAVDKRDAEES
jgi:hypothetical protein